jgi:uncharacterized protein
VLVVGVATGKIKATNKPFEDNWVFAITVRDGKVTNIREYIDTRGPPKRMRAPGSRLLQIQKSAEAAARPTADKKLLASLP